MHYRSVANLNRDILAWMKDLPNDLDLIVGIPRSGLLAANLLALHRNLPLTDVEGLLEGKVITGGQRCRQRSTMDLSSSKLSVLVIDDSVWQGSQMAATKHIIRTSNITHNIRYAAVYVAPGSENAVDFFFEVVPMPRLFEWNIMHHSWLRVSCVDIDGVLCDDPTEDENDDGELYCRFLQNAEAFVVPSKTIGWLVTCRLEKYRHLTESWLEKHGINYNELIMMDLPNKQARVASGAHAAFKANVYQKTGARLFIESSSKQAVQIVKLSGKYVFCTETMEMLSPSNVIRHYRRGQRFARRLRSDPKEALRRLWQLVWSE